MSVDLPDDDKKEQNGFSDDDLAFFRELQDCENETLRTVGEIVVQSSTREDTNS